MGWGSWRSGHETEGSGIILESSRLKKGGETKALYSEGVACGEWMGEMKGGVGKAFKERMKEMSHSSVVWLQKFH